MLSDGRLPRQQQWCTVLRDLRRAAYTPVEYTLSMKGLKHELNVLRRNDDMLAKAGTSQAIGYEARVTGINENGTAVVERA